MPPRSMSLQSIDIFKAKIYLKNMIYEQHFCANFQIGHFSNRIRLTPSVFKKAFGSKGYMFGVLVTLFNNENR